MRLESVRIWLEGQMGSDPVGSRGISGLIEDISCPCLTYGARCRAVKSRMIHGAVRVIKTLERTPAQVESNESPRSPTPPVDPDQNPIRKIGFFI